MQHVRQRGLLCTEHGARDFAPKDLRSRFEQEFQCGNGQWPIRQLLNSLALIRCMLYINVAAYIKTPGRGLLQLGFTPDLLPHK